MMQVDDHVPLPLAERRTDTWTHTIENLNVGQSVVVPDTKRGTARVICWRVKKRMGREFVTRREDDGIRIWRAA